MKAVAFTYERPDSIQAACRALAADEDARPIAGGQSLIPMLAMRLARPSKLIDVLRIPGMSGIEQKDGAVVIGAMTRQVEVERSKVVADSLPLLAKAISWVGHLATRTRGTIGGSVAHADPSAEIPLVALTLGAELVVADETGEQVLPLDDYFIGPTITVLPQASLIVAVRFPLPGEKHIGTGFHEVSPRKGDFALAAAAATVALDDERRCSSIGIGVGGAADTPLRLDLACEALRGTRLGEEEVAEAVDGALAEVETTRDLHATSEYRRRVAGALARRAVLEARDEALGHIANARHAPH